MCLIESKSKNKEKLITSTGDSDTNSIIHIIASTNLYLREEEKKRKEDQNWKATTKKRNGVLSSRV